MSRDGLFVRATMALVAILLASDTHAQFASARRMAMGGVNLLHGGPGGDAVNVAYRAVPPEPRDRARSWSLPIGLIPVLQDPPSLDPDDSTFNAFELANLALHPPWNLALRKPEAPVGDVGARRMDAQHVCRVLFIGDDQIDVPQRVGHALASQVGTLGSRSPVPQLLAEV